MRLLTFLEVSISDSVSSKTKFLTTISGKIAIYFKYAKHWLCGLNFIRKSIEGDLIMKSMCLKSDTNLFIQFHENFTKYTHMQAFYR